jgi:hypothetical protein
MNTLIIEASGQTRFSWKSEHAISHFLHPLHLDSSLATQIGSFLGVNCKPLKRFVDFPSVSLDLNVMFKGSLQAYVFATAEAQWLRVLIRFTRLIGLV